MSNQQAPTITPTSTLFDVESNPNNLSIGGTTETHAVSAYVNGSTDNVSYDFQDNSWSFNTEINEYGEHVFTVVSENGSGEISDSSIATSEIVGPSVEKELYNSLTTPISGRANYITSKVEAKHSDSLSFSDAGVTFLPPNDFVLTGFTFTNPEETIVFRAKDSLGNASEEISKVVSYKLSGPLIDSFTNPVSSIYNVLTGSADLETVELSYTPIGSSGYFTSGAVTGGYAPHVGWSYEFVMMGDSEEFGIKSVDIFGQETEEARASIDYKLPQVIPILPHQSSTSSLSNSLSGFCSSASKKVMFSTLNNLDDENSESVKIVSSNKGNYLFNSTNNILDLTVGGVRHKVSLPTGVVTSQDIVDKVNSYFTKAVSYETSGRVGLKGNSIQVNSGTGNAILGFEVREYSVSIELQVNLTYPKTFEERDTLDVNIDGVDYLIKFEGEYQSLEEIIEEINSQVGSKVAFSGSLILSATTNFYIKKEFPDFDINSKIYVGEANYTLGDTQWFFDHNLEEKTITFFISTLDTFGNYNNPVELTLSYEIDSPVIVSPGEVKSLTDNVATSGSVANSFETTSGSFVNDGVLLGDKVLSLSGNNAGEVYGITSVSEKTIETDGSPVWSEGDAIYVYTKETRPDFNTNKLTVDGRGSCDPDSLRIIYATEYLQDIKVYSQFIGPFNITPTHSTLTIRVDGREESITLPTGLDIGVIEIVSRINSYFVDDVAFSDKETFYIKGNRVDILDGSANIVFDLTVGEYSLSAGMLFDEPVNFPIGDADLKVNLNIDLKDIKFSFETGTDLSKQTIVDKINSLSAKKVAFLTPSGINLLGRDSIKVNTSVSLISMTPLIYERAIYTQGVGEWNSGYKIFGNQTNFIVYGQDYLYSYTAPSILPIVYKIDPPVVTTYPLESTRDICDISGTFDPEGTKVQLDGEDAFGDSGDWTYTLVDLINGGNNLKAVTIDKFGTPSPSSEFIFTYNDIIANTPAPEPGPNALKWASVESPSLSNDTIDTLLSAVNDVFKPVLSALKAVSEILKIVKAFIAGGLSWMSVVRLAVQGFIDELVELISQIVNGGGVYILNTLPVPSLVTPERPILSFIEGGFPGFINRVDRSLSDKNDAYRPQLNKSSKVGAYVIAVSDNGGVDKLLKSVQSLVKIVSKEILDVGMSEPVNIRVSGENKRVVLTWKADPNRVRPGGYRVYRSEVSGGIPITKKVKTQVPKKNGEKYSDEFVRDSVSGEIKTDYELVGEIAFKNPLNNGGVVGALTGTLENVQQVAVDDFKFVDGIATINEKESNTAIDAVMSGAVAYMDAFTEAVLVITEESGVELENGKTYYYQVRSFVYGNDVEGKSPELVGTPSRPDLLLMTENLGSQMIKRDKGGNALNYILSSAIFDESSGVFASDPSALEIKVDGGIVQPSKIFYTQGSVVLDKENSPKRVVTAKYWGKKPVNSTRAYLEGKKQGTGPEGEYLMKKDDKESYTLSIQVGLGSNLPQAIGVASSISLDQTVTLVRDFTEGLEKNPVDTKWVTPDEVVSLIRAQTSGLKVRLNKKSQIVIEENQNPNIHKGSVLTITGGNSALGFDLGATSVAGPLTGTPPDWYSIRVSDLFPIFNDMLGYVQNTMNTFLSSLEGATKALTDFIELLEVKVEALADLAKKVQKFINDIIENLTIQGGFYFLEIPFALGGNDYFMDSLKNATGSPEDSDYAGGVVFLYSSGATGKALDFILAPIKNA